MFGMVFKLMNSQRHDQFTRASINDMKNELNIYNNSNIHTNSPCSITFMDATVHAWINHIINYNVNMRAILFLLSMYMYKCQSIIQ